MVRSFVAAVVATAALVSGMVRILPGTIGVAGAATDVTAWATIGDIAPAVGCLVDASVEVRRDGVVAPDVEVGMALVLDGEILAADRGYTGGDGLAYLGIDTSAGEAGREVWLDVLIGGDYAGGMPLTLTDDGGCADAPEVLEVYGSAPVAHSPETSDGWVDPGTPIEASAWSDPAAAAPASEPLPMWVPQYQQQRGLSCEYAAATIAMAHFGADVTEYAFDDLVGVSENPHWGFRGDITGAWGGTDDYGVYAAALAPALSAFGFWGEAFYADGDPSALTARLDSGRPTLVWLGLWGDTSFDAYAADGSRFLLAPGQHVVTAYGYDEGGVSVSDPGTGQYVYYSWPAFMEMWNVFDGMALAVGPA